MLFVLWFGTFEMIATPQPDEMPLVAVSKDKWSFSQSRGFTPWSRRIASSIGDGIPVLWLEQFQKQGQVMPSLC